MRGACAGVRVPPVETVLNGLTTLANDWRSLAITWHLLLAALLVMLLAGWRPSSRVVACLSSAPILCVGALAWVAGNPFNATVFTVLGGTLVAGACRLSNTTVRFASSTSIAVGAAIIVFGATYPHFTKAASWTTYLYASPFGILPCPTLAVVIGITLLLRSLWSNVATLGLAAAGLLYGAVGVFRLGVALDWGLLVASVLLLFVLLEARKTRGEFFDGTRICADMTAVAAGLRPARGEDQTGTTSRAAT